MDSVARTVRDRVLRSRDRFWRIEDFVGAPHAVTMELRRLRDAGELDHVRRGVYWRGHKTRFGMAVPAAVRALREVVGDREAVGAAGGYATNLLGLSTQVSPEPVVSTTRRPPTGVKGVRVVNRASRTARRDARLNDIEVTFLEALEVWNKYVDIGHRDAMKRFVEVLKRENVRVDRVVSASRTEPPVVRERLRAVLEHGGWKSEARLIARARSSSSKQRALQVVPS